MKKSIKNLEVKEIKNSKAVKGGSDETGYPSPLYEKGFVPVHPVIM